MTASFGENEIISTREFDATPEVVYEAWTDPKLLASWWGPSGFTSTFHEFDLRPGGEWRFVMHGPNGADYPNHSVFIEIVPRHRIVLRHLSNPEFQLTADFEDLGGRTRLYFRQLFKTPETFEQVKTYCVEGNEQNFDRLAELLGVASV